MAVPATISHAVQQNQIWLKEPQDDAGFLNETEAWSVFRAVLHKRRDRLPVEETVQLAAQLPLVLRGKFYQGWQSRKVPDKSIRSQQDFFDAVTMRLLPKRLPLKGLWPLTARTFKERVR